MKQDQAPISTHKSRRRALKNITIGGSVSALAVSSMPNEWIKPVVDTVILPAHAACSAACDVQLSIIARDIPIRNCSGGLENNPVQLTVGASEGCGDIDILDIQNDLPAGAVMMTDLGSTLAPGASATIDITGYPSAGTGGFTCQPGESGSIVIVYNCAGFDGAPQSFAINVAQEIIDDQSQAAPAAPQPAQLEQPAEEEQAAEVQEVPIEEAQPAEEEQAAEEETE